MTNAYPKCSFDKGLQHAMKDSDYSSPNSVKKIPNITSSKHHIQGPPKCYTYRDVETVKASNMIGYSSSAISVLNQAELSISDIDYSNLIHMDVEQSFLPMPTPAKAAVFESFARQNVSGLAALMQLTLKP
ncbi:hypothetical protein AgCh_018439 [Apium graveolens]